MSNARKILLVVGEPAARKSFEQALSGKGYTVTTAASGEDALWQLGNGSYDALFTEITLRGISGLDVAEQLHFRQPGLPVVALDSSGAAKQHAPATGVTEFLHKPFSPGQLADTADRLLGLAGKVASVQPTPAAEAASSHAKNDHPLSRLKSIILFLMAPIIGLAYLVAFPVAVVGMFGWQAIQQPEDAEAQPTAPVKSGFFKTIAMIFAVILIGIFYTILGPIIGIGALLWFGFHAWGKVGAKAMRP